MRRARREYWTPIHACVKTPGTRSLFQIVEDTDAVVLSGLKPGWYDGTERTGEARRITACPYCHERL